jgi:hypothetical protein
MKKILLIIVFAFSAATLSYGQFALGIKLGYNANKLSSNLDSIKSSVNSGFHIGIWSHFGKRLYFAPELQYTLSGAVFTKSGNISANDWKQKITIGSLDVPLLLGFKIIHSDFITWRIELGPEASFVVNQKIKDETSVTGPITTANVSTANWYILGGTGIDILFLKLDIRYQYGLNQMIKDVSSTGSSAATFDSKNQMFVVSLGFKIFGKK